MINEEWINKIKSWLEEGEDLAENIIDIPWEVEISEGETTDCLYSDHPSTPFTVQTIVGKFYATLFLNTQISTDTYDNIEKMRIYKKLLCQNSNMNMAKASLIGDNDNVAVSVDLDLASLNKEEFNDALSALLYSAMQLVIKETFDLMDELSEWFMNQIVNDCEEIYKSGKKEDIVGYLVNKVGWEKESAEDFVKDLVQEMEKAEAQEAQKPAANKYGPPKMYS